MKVLMLADGSSIHSQRVLDWHLRQGCEVTFLDYQDPRPGGAEGYRFVPYATGVRGGRYVRAVFGERAAEWLEERLAARRLRAVYRSVRPDVVHVYQIDRRAYHCFRAGLK